MTGKHLHVLVMASGLVCASLAQVSIEERSQQPSPSAQYEQLNRRVYDANERPQRAVSEEVTTELRALVARELKAVMSRSDDPATVRKTMAGAQGAFALNVGRESETNTPFAEGFKINGQQGMAVAFVVLRGGSAIPDTLPVLQFYTKELGEWKLRAETDADFHGCSYMVSSLESPVLGESWWLSWGQTYGDTGARRKVRLYAFDGETVKTVWHRDELRAGSIRVAKDRKTVVLEYYRKEGTPEQPRPDLLIREEWYLTPDGPQQSSSAIVGDAGSIGTTPQ
jgi:hypothetical protein